MKQEYDFSNAERGKFHRPDAQLIAPIHLDPEVLAYYPIEPKRAAFL